MLGTSLGSTVEDQYNNISKTSFGADTSDTSAFFTGKPYINELGYAFLLRNYRADTGKWLSQDLIGYPDGWNNHSYCGNSVIITIDFLGCNLYTITIHIDGGAGGGATSSGGSSNSSTSGFGHGWVTVSTTGADGKATNTTRGFYPNEDPRSSALFGKEYKGEIRNDSNRDLGYVEKTYAITEQGYLNAMKKIADWERNTPNWSLDNNCMNFMIDILTHPEQIPTLIQRIGKQTVGLILEKPSIGFFKTEER